MDLIIRTAGDCLVISFRGRVNLEGEASLVFKDRLKRLLADGTDRVLVDLGNVGFIDSQGLGALISGLKVLRQSNGSLMLANVSEPVEAVLRITRLVRVFDIFETVEDGLVSLARSGNMAH